MAEDASDCSRSGAIGEPPHQNPGKGHGGQPKTVRGREEDRKRRTGGLRDITGGNHSHRGSETFQDGTDLTITRFFSKTASSAAPIEMRDLFVT